MSRYYTGVGSRNTPPEIGSLMWEIAKLLQKEGFILRSGGAKGADSFFEGGAGIDKQIFYAKDADQAAMAIAAQFHPAWGACSDYAKKLHGRNAFQVLGLQLSVPSEFLICWTPDGCKSHATRTRATGGTGTAISIADAYGVPIYNLANEGDRLYWESIVAQGSLSPPEDANPHKLHTIYTAHYRYGGPDRTDITVKGQDPMGRYFAPTWEMVQGVKNGTMTEQQYIDLYMPTELNANTVLGKVPVNAWNWLLSEPTRTFVCFCNKDQFCHRNILLNYILGVMNGRIVYGGWRD